MYLRTDCIDAINVIHHEDGISGLNIYMDNTNIIQFSGERIAMLALEAEIINCIQAGQKTIMIKEE